MTEYQLTPRGAAGAAKTVFALRPRDPQKQSNMASQFASGIGEGAVRLAALPVDVPSIFGAAADWVGGEGTSRQIGATMDALAAPALSTVSGLINSGTKAAADALGLSPEAKANIPQISPLLSQNYQKVRDVAGGDAIVGQLRNAGITSNVAPEDAGQRYARTIGEFLGGSILPVGATLSAARNAARAGTAGSFLAPVAANPAKFIGANAAAATSGGIASEAAFDATGSQGARVAGGILGGFLPGALMSGVRRAFTGGAAGRDSIRQAMDDYAAIGSTPTLGQATAGAKSPLGGIIDRGLSIGQPGFYSRRLGEQAANAEGYVQSSLARATPVAPSDVGAGIAARKGAEDFVDRFRQVSKKAYDRVDNLIPPDAPAVMTQTQTALGEIASRFSATPEIAKTIQSPTIRKFVQAIQDDAAQTGTIPYKSLKAIRTEIFAAKNSDSGLLQDINRADLTKLYDALSQDMAATAKTVGGSRAVKALETANKIYAQGAQRIENVIDPIAKGATPEAIFRSIERGDPSRVAQYMAVLSPEQRATVTSRILEKLGSARPSEAIPGESGFSFNTFLTNYNKMKGNQALDVLFNRQNIPALGGKGVEVMRQSLDRLSAIASRARSIDKVFYNPSGTANRLLEGATGWQGIGGSALLSPTVAGTLLTAKLMSGLGARTLNSPAFLKWLSTTPAITAQKWPAHLARLETVARQNPELAGEVQKLQRELTEGKDSLDKLSTIMSVVPGMGGVVATVNDARNYASGKRDLTAENLALTAMNIVPEVGGVMGKADEAGGLIRMDDPLRSGVAVAAGDPQAFLASLRIQNPTNPALGAAGALSEPVARSAGVPFGPDQQQPQEQSQGQTEQQAKPMSGADLLGGRIASGLDWLTMGAGDEILAGAAALLDAPPEEARRMLGLEAGSSPTYDRELATARGLMKQYRKERPGEALAVGLPAAIGGAIATGTGKLALQAGGMIKGGIAGALEAAARGGMAGFLSGEGGTEARAKAAGDAAVYGSILGGGLGMGAPAFQSGVKWLREQKDFFNFLTGTLTADGKKLAQSLGVNPQGFEKELNTVTKEAVKLANELMKDPQGARTLLNKAVEGLKKGGVNGNLDTNLVVQTLRNVVSDKNAVYDPAWRRVFGEALNPEKPLYKALAKLAAGQVGDKASTWEKILPMVVREAEKRLGPQGPTSRFWNPADYKPKPITPKVEAVDVAMKGVKPRNTSPSGAFGPPI